MDGVHDLGGTEGFGPLPIEEEEPVFHHDWEARVMAMRMLMGAWRKWNLDAGRHSVEQLPPADYLSLTYYEKWLASLVNLSVGAGLLSREEVASGRADATPKATPPIDADGFRALMAKGRPSGREVNTAPAHAPGDRVRCNSFSHSGHTRLPRYVRGHVGEIILYHAAHVLPDASSKMIGEAPEHLYTVRFLATDLWGPDADPNHSVTADLWESYIEPA
ncbi:MAG: nitrile hydratase subunit beta [Pseudomonadota bacterium]